MIISEIDYMNIIVFDSLRVELLFLVVVNVKL